MANPKPLTPMMQQFFDFKAKHPEALLLFRCGDFYETYHDDAIEASRLLGITLTRRNNGGGGDATAMAGFPYHALDVYLPKLIRAGRRVAICDQLEDPKMTKKLVKRGITELVTPGVTMADNVLTGRENNFLAAIHFGKGSCGVALLDVSTGEFLVDEGTADHVAKLLANFMPKEVLYNKEKRRDYIQFFGTKMCVYEMDDWAFNLGQAQQKLHEQFGVRNLKGFGVDHLKNAITAAGAVMHYLEYTQHTGLQHITSLTRIEEERFMRLDGFTIRSLELVQPMNADGTSLLNVIDNTTTPMGARMLRRWMVFPLKSVQKINHRLDVVDCFFREPQLHEFLTTQMQAMGDMERMISRAAVGRINPREVVMLKNALVAVGAVKEACLRCDNPTLHTIAGELDGCTALSDSIDRTMMPDPPLAVNRGNVIRTGFNEELDQLRSISQGGRDYLLDLQQREAEKTGISSLKVGYNNVFGYYLEVRNTFRDRVPGEWVRKQTLAQAERYITQELKEYEEKILGADDRIASLEERLFNALVAEIQQYISTIQHNAALVAEADCLLSFATVARRQHYIRPQVDDSMLIDIRQGRHPVIETQMAVGESYVPNDTLLDNTTQQIIMITGPNMAGKSALLRQTALIVILAQMGCYVPAQSAHIGIVDKVFTRVGASDNISQGESTFMVEMTEAANILNNATDRSLVLFDELGRGTSTYDGISIAWSIVEYLHETQGAQARTLFATHYHELNEMEKHFDRIKNYNVSVRDVNGEIIFLRRLERGGTAHSFGIHVAEIAGMPQSIIKRSEAVLSQLEQEAQQVGNAGRAEQITCVSDGGTQLSFFQLDDPVLSQIRDQLLSLDINNLTPVQALNALNDIKKLL